MSGRTGTRTVGRSSSRRLVTSRLAVATSTRMRLVPAPIAQQFSQQRVMLRAVRGITLSLEVQNLHRRVCLGSSSGSRWRKGAHHAGPELARTEIERQQPAGCRIREQHVLPERRSARPKVATRQVFPTPPASDKTESTGGAPSRLTCAGSSAISTGLKADCSAYHRVDTASVGHGNSGLFD